MGILTTACFYLLSKGCLHLFQDAEFGNAGTVSWLCDLALSLFLTKSAE